MNIIFRIKHAVITILIYFKIFSFKSQHRKSFQDRKARKTNSLCFEASDMIINDKDENEFQDRCKVIFFLYEAFTMADVIRSFSTPPPTIIINTISRDNLVQ